MWLLTCTAAPSLTKMSLVAEFVLVPAVPRLQRPLRWFNILEIWKFKLLFYFSKTNFQSLKTTV